MVKAPGLKFVVFADDPNKQKETLDIVVIAPEVKKTLPQVESAWVTDHGRGPGVGRPLGDAKAPWPSRSSAGKRSWAPSKAFSDWGAYEAGLAEIASRTAPQKRTIAVLTKQAED